MTTWGYHSFSPAALPCLPKPYPLLFLWLLLTSSSFDLHFYRLLDKYLDIRTNKNCTEFPPKASCLLRSHQPIFEFLHIRKSSWTKPKMLHVVKFHAAHACPSHKLQPQKKKKKTSSLLPNQGPYRFLILSSVIFVFSLLFRTNFFFPIQITGFKNY